MITKIEIDGFKSFKDFRMEFTPLTIIAGLNASGKSNLFDALQLLSRIVEVDLRTAFGEQRGDANELFLKYSNEQSATVMTFVVEMVVDKKVKDNWGNEAELEETHLSYEIIIERRIDGMGFEDLCVLEELLFKVNWFESDGRRYALGGGSPISEEVVLSQSFLSSALRVDNNKYMFAVREEMRNWKIMQLNPEDLREPTRRIAGISDVISRTGKNLAAALYRLSREDEYALTDISRKLNHFLPEYIEVTVDNDKANQQFLIKLKGEDGRFFSSRVLSEGTLRLLTLCTLLYDDAHKNVLCFEEPENGIHPYQIRSMIQLLKDLSEPVDGVVRQVIVNTHSPIVVGEAKKWMDNQHVSVMFARTNTLVTTFDAQPVKVKITKMTPVFDQLQASSEYSEQEQKLTIAEIVNYLDSSVFPLEKPTE